MSAPLPRVAERARGTLVILRRWPGQRRAPYLPRERLEERRDARVRETVRYAAESVPFYRELFRRERLDPREFRSADDLAQLPEIDRALVASDPERFRSTSPLGRDAVPLRTSGSSGMPLTVYHDRTSILADIAYGERERAVTTSLIGKRFRYAVLVVEHRTATRLSVSSAHASSSFRPFRPRLHRVALEEPLERVIETMNTVRPEVVGAFGSYLELLFKTIAARGGSTWTPRLAVYGGDTVAPASRRFIEETFGVPVLSVYNAVEAFKIGFFCEERRGFHLHEDLCHVRAREDGELVVSNLVNRGTVLLNYRIGDLARFLPDACPCGRTFALLSELQGRVNEIVRLPNGAILHPFYVTALTRSWPGLVRYQLVQHEPASFELRVVTSDRKTFEAAADRIVSELRAVAGGAAVELTFHDELAPGPRGKFSPVVALPAERIA